MRDNPPTIGTRTLMIGHNHLYRRQVENRKQYLQQFADDQNPNEIADQDQHDCDERS